MGEVWTKEERVSSSLAPRARVRVSEHGIQNGIYRGKQPDRLGTVVRVSRDGIIANVRWDGNRTHSSIHHSFIDVIANLSEPAPAPAMRLKPLVWPDHLRAYVLSQKGVNSARKIAAELGCTRNSVIGIWYRAKNSALAKVGEP